MGKAHRSYIFDDADISELFTHSVHAAIGRAVVNQNNLAPERRDLLCEDRSQAVE
jgi:hypothetical protein